MRRIEETIRTRLYRVQLENGHDSVVDGEALRCWTRAVPRSREQAYLPNSGRSGIGCLSQSKPSDL